MNKKGKQYIILKTRAKESILNQLIYMKDEKDENIFTPFNYEIINEKTKENKTSTLFIIMNNIMKANIKKL